MKKLLVLFTLFSAVTSYAKDSIVATYNNEKVTETEISDYYNKNLRSLPNFKGKDFKQLSKDVQERILKGYISGKLLLIEGSKMKVEELPDFKQKLSDVKSHLIQQQVVENYMKTAITDDKIEKEYQKIAKDLKNQDELKVSHILVDSEDKAKDLKQKLNKGSSFTELAKEHSKDTSSKGQGGLIGYFSKGQLVPEFEQQAFSMKVGEISSPVKTQYGWHIIKLEDRRKVKVASKEELKPSIVNALTQKIIEDYLEEVQKKANVKINLN